MSFYLLDQEEKTRMSKRTPNWSQIKYLKILNYNKLMIQKNLKIQKVVNVQILIVLDFIVLVLKILVTVDHNANV